MIGVNAQIATGGGEGGGNVGIGFAIPASTVTQFVEQARDGQLQPEQDPYGQVDPYGQPVDPYGQPVDPYGQPVDPYGQPVDPYGQSQADPYAPFPS